MKHTRDISERERPAIDGGAGPRFEPVIGTQLSGSLASIHLDLLRGVAAFAVYAGHLRGMMFEDYDAARHHHILLRLMYFVTRLGHQAVMVFFVLSGFLIAGSGIRAFNANRWSLRTYCRNRLTRLYVVLIPALMLGLLWDRVGIHFFGTRGIYGGGLNHVIYFAVPPRLRMSVMAGNGAYLQTIVVPAFGSNGPLWSLANEFWYYALFGVSIALASIERDRIVARLAALAVLLIIASIIGPGMAPGLIIWVAGAGINFLPQFERGRRLVLGSSLVLIAGALMLSRTVSAISSDFTVAAASCALIYALLQSRSRIEEGIYARLSRQFAAMSYTLYLVHVPWLVFVSAWIVGTKRWEPDLVHLAWGAMIGISGLLYAFAVASFTEAKTESVRDLMFGQQSGV